MSISRLLRQRFPGLDGYVKDNPFRFIRDSRYRRSFKRGLYERLGRNYDHWLRTAQVEAWHASLSKLDLSKMDALEISPGARNEWRSLGFRLFDEVQFPDFDICEMRTDRQYDLIIADNVFEHLMRPHKAARNVYEMLNAGGYFYITTPFLVRVHGDDDYYRWTERGLAVLLEDAGFSRDDISIESWGNHASVKANLDDFLVHGWRRDMRNVPHLPVAIWAVARKKEA